MTLIRWLQALSDAVPPMVVALAVLMLTAVAAAVIAARTDSATLVGYRAHLAYLVLAPACLLAVGCGPWWLAAALAAPALLGLALAIFKIPETLEDDPRAGGGRLARAGYPAAACLLSAVLILANLGGPSGRVMIWEYDTAWSLIQALQADQPTASFISQRLGWNLGLVSTGDDALLYGTGVHLAWKVLPISPASLRLPAALLALASLPVAFLAARRCAGATAAAATTACVALAPPLIYYGRYGTSLSGSLLAVLLAVAACCWLVGRGAVRWWAGLVAGAGLYLATLGYAPARLTVVGLLIAVLLAAAMAIRAQPRRLVPVLVLMAVVATVWLVQHRLGRADHFVDVRGEQVFRMLSQSGWLNDYLALDLEPDELGWNDRLAVASRLLENTLPELGNTLARGLSLDLTRVDLLELDPPRLPLYAPWMLVFALVGFARSCRRWRTPANLLLLAAFVVSIVPVLFTTRVDAHRLVTVVAPVVIWSGVGIAWALTVARSLATPGLLLHVCGAALLLLTAAEGARLLHHPNDPASPTAARVLAATQRARGPVAVISRLDVQDLGAVVLAAAERQRREPVRAPRVLHRDLALALSDDGGHGKDQLPVLVSAAERGPAMLVPDLAFDELAGLARDHGLGVEHRTEGDLRYWWITVGE